MSPPSKGRPPVADPEANPTTTSPHQEPGTDHPNGRRQCACRHSPHDYLCAWRRGFRAGYWEGLAGHRQWDLAAGDD